MTSFTTIAWLVWLSMTIWLYSAISLRVKIRGFQCLNVTLKRLSLWSVSAVPLFGCKDVQTLCGEGYSRMHAYMKLWHSMQETGYFRLLPPFYNDPSVDSDLTQQNEWWLLLMMPRLLRRLLPPFVCARSPWQRVALYGQFVLRTWSKRVLRHWDTLPRLVCVMPQTMATNSANIGYRS